MKKTGNVFGYIIEFVKKVHRDIKRDALPKIKKVYAEFKEGEHDDIVLCLFVLNFMFQCIYYMIYWG